MPFSNPITAGGILVQPEIRSPNFSLTAGTGWAILANGNAYFFNLTAAGTITGSTVVVEGTTGGVFTYSGLPAFGNMTASITGAPGTDAEGNAYPAGITAYSPSGVPVIQVQPALSAILIYGD